MESDPDHRLSIGSDSMNSVVSITVRRSTPTALAILISDFAAVDPAFPHAQSKFD